MTRRRIYLIVFLILIGFTALGSATTVDRSEADKILEDVRKTVPATPSIIDIFSNNIRVVLLMLIPGLGLILAPYVLYNTGLVFSASGVVNNISGVTLFLTTTILPFFWLEFAAYAASITQNLYLIWAIKSKILRYELRNLAYTLIAIAALLLLGAWVEMIFISS
ncbi:MAG: stage II sporulation protein M [Thaumarchaeota archaeon]|nr:stage II sporulation protein M [Nitrososphaerota archaeon]